MLFVFLSLYDVGFDGMIASVLSEEENQMKIDSCLSGV